MARQKHAPTPVQVPPPAWQGLFIGAATAEAGPGPFCAGSQQALLVLGPPRSGKTSALVIPNVLIAPGAVVTTSTKTDVLNWTAKTRSLRGRTWLFDPSGSTEPGFLTPLRWSPVSGCETWQVAQDRAHALCTAARPARNPFEDHWTERAEALIAPLLHAAALGHKPMTSVLRWVLRRDIQEALDLAYRGGGHDLAAYTIEGVLATEERELSGIFSTAANVLAAYRNPVALEQASEPNFDPEAFARSSETVYICAPAAEQVQLAPLVVALLEAIRRATYKRGTGYPPVVFVLDEVANIAPLPNLPAIVSEGGGQGLVTLACLQDLSQARARWGAAADGFLTLFGWKALLPGIADLATLQLVSALAGEKQVVMQSYTSNGSIWTGNLSGAKTYYAQRVPVMRVDEVSRLSPGTALVLGPGEGPGLLRLVPCWEEPWAGVLRQAEAELSYLTRAPGALEA
jgi:type IV secretion system protein VirD4